MKKIIYSTILILSVLFIYSFTNFDNNQDKNWNDCVKKYKSEWGKPCQKCTYNEDIYKVYFKNICNEKIDLLISVQEKNKTWNCVYKTDFAPNDTVVGYACKGTGKYLYWVKKAGDTEITFPTRDEINKMYKD